MSTDQDFRITVTCHQCGGTIGCTSDVGAISEIPKAIEDHQRRCSPPLPAEPKNNTDWRARQAVFSRRDQWTESNGDRHWYSNIGEAKYYPCAWEDVLAYAGERGALIELRPDPAVDSPDLPWRDPDRDIQVRIQYGGIGDPYLEVDLLEDAVTYHADDGLKDLGQLIGALSRGRAQLHAELNGSSPSGALRSVRPEGEINK
jgi:hypothetical protein